MNFEFTIFTFAIEKCFFCFTSLPPGLTSGFTIFPQLMIVSPEILIHAIRKETHKRHPLNKTFTFSLSQSDVVDWLTDWLFVPFIFVKISNGEPNLGWEKSNLLMFYSYVTQVIWSNCNLALSLSLPSSFRRAKRKLWTRINKTLWLNFV